MYINDEINAKENQIKEKKINKRKAIYFSVFGFFAAIVLALLSLTVYTNIRFEVGFFNDYSMAPTINKNIFNEDGKVEMDNFTNRNGNVVEYGLVDAQLNISNLKRFDIVVLKSGSTIGSALSTLRIVGLPGEKVYLDTDGNLFINDTLTKQPIPDEYLKVNWKNIPHSNNKFELQLSEKQYCLLKDNRYYYVNDSRTYGAYDEEKIYGVVKAIQGTCTINNGRCINRTIPISRFI